MKLKIVGIFALMIPTIATAAPKRFPITDFGGKGDGTTSNTQSIQAAIDKCAAEGGGLVVVPAGTFLTGPISLKQGVGLRIEKDAVLKSTGGGAVISAQDLTGIEVTGRGTIDASGSAEAIRISDCRQVHLSDLKLEGAKSAALRLLSCEDVIAEILVVRSPTDVPDVDGIVVDSCRRMHLLNCDVTAGRDCVSVRATAKPCEDILIEEFHAGKARGGIAIGPEIAMGIRNIDVRDSVINDGNQAVIRILASRGAGGAVQDVSFSDIHPRDVGALFEIDMNAGAPGSVFRNIKLTSVSGPVDSAGIVRGLPSSPIENLKFQNCNVQARTGLTLENAKDPDLAGLRVTAREGPAVIRSGPSPSSAP